MNITSNKIILNIPKQNLSDDASTWPINPVELREYKQSEDSFLKSGKEDYFNIVKNFNSSEIQKVLDFGCSDARVTRWWDTSKIEVWGCDPQFDKISCAKELIGSKINLFTNSELVPHLPFQDNYFDLIYAQSIFTHIKELHVIWLLELLRISKKYLYITLHDEECMDENLTERASFLRSKRFTELPQNIDPNIGFFASNFYKNVAQVYISEKYLTSILPPFAKVVKKIPRAYANLQTAYIISK
jgi:ubiquinone/menaquinone biosynthesis C-methylase UbiE